jgi:uncharacterized protein (DUF3820 family)
MKVIDKKLQKRVSRSTAYHWRPAWLDEVTTAEPELKPTEPEVEPPNGDTVCEPDDNPFVTPAEEIAYSEWCWTQVDPHDYRDMTRPRVYPQPCPWCGGRLRHNPLCDELRSSWEPTVPFGMHKGKRLSDVPHDYLEWLKTVVSDPELKAAIKLRLEVRR